MSLITGKEDGKSRVLYKRLRSLSQEGYSCDEWNRLVQAFAVEALSTEEKSDNNKIIQVAGFMQGVASLVAYLGEKEEAREPIGFATKTSFVTFLFCRLISELERTKGLEEYHMEEEYAEYFTRGVMYFYNNL